MKLRTECLDYVETQFDAAIPRGHIHPERGYRSEDLEHQTFADEIFDLVITQDVFEHLFRPDLAIREIARTLRPGGAHVCTVPLVRDHHPSVRRARIVNDKVDHILPPEYHHNPMTDDGALVTVDWGFDIALYFSHHADLTTTIVHIDDLEHGIRADLNEVLVCRKLALPNVD
jgi:SAM-dependent methyltransferase